MAGVTADNWEKIMGRDIYCLYSRPSFFEGVARLFDFGNWLNRYNYSRSEEEADLRSIGADWQFTGEDLQRALEKFAKESVIEDLDD